jgi:hypothetical protein
VATLKKRGHKDFRRYRGSKNRFSAFFEIIQKRKNGNNSRLPD